jgi:uncharacterized protein (TIGR00730 family)
MSSKKNICVYCASSQACSASYHDAARALGRVLSENGYSVIYGGGAVGSMGALAEGVLAAGGTIVGVMPEFMMKLEWARSDLTELRVVEDMRVRKHMMLSESQGLVALPGGSGTLEELFEAITLKRLGIYTHPIVLVNTKRYFDPLLEFLRHSVSERFMSPQHLEMWQVVSVPDEVPKALAESAPWSSDAREFATVS